MNCAKCSVEIKNKKDSIACTECNRNFHVNCIRSIPPAGRPTTRSGAATPWRCDDCMADSKPESEPEANNVMDMLRLIRQEMATDRISSKVNFDNLNKSINLVQESLKDLKQKINTVESEQAIIKADVVSLKEENEQLSRRVEDLEGRINDVEQYSRICNLEIRGIPLTTAESVLAIVEKLAEVLGVAFSREDISTCHRLPTPRDARYHPTIVVQFISRATKARWLAAAKVKKVETQELSPNLRPGKIFINEHLTGYNKTVLSRGRRLVKEGKLAYAWCKDGKLFVRKSPSSPVKRVWSVLDVEDAAGQAGYATAVKSTGGDTNVESQATKS